MTNFSLQHFRFHLEPKGALQMPPCLLEHCQAYNKDSALRLTPKGNVIRWVWEQEGVVRFD